MLMLLWVRRDVGVSSDSCVRVRIVSVVFLPSAGRLLVVCPSFVPPRVPLSPIYDLWCYGGCSTVHGSTS